MAYNLPPTPGIINRSFGANIIIIPWKRYHFYHDILYGLTNNMAFYTLFPISLMAFFFFHHSTIMPNTVVSSEL